MSSECTVNFGIKWDCAVDIRSRPVIEFAREITKLEPELDQAEQDRESGTLDLFQPKGRTVLRQVRIRSESLQSAAGWELEPEKQVTFVEHVAQAASELKLSMLDVKLVDLRHVYQVKHWGNHNELIGTTLLTPQSPLHSVLAAIDGDLLSLRIAFAKAPANCRDLNVAVDLTPATVLSEIRSGDYDGDRINIICGIARTGGFVRVESFSEVLRDLSRIWHESVRDAIIKWLDGPLRESAVDEKPKNRD